MPRAMFRLTVFAFLLHACTAAASDECPPAAADPNGYLRKICEFIHDKRIDVRPAVPSQYKIKDVQEIEAGGKRVLRVRLDCCYMGDTALIDSKTGKVLGFSPGPK